MKSAANVFLACLMLAWAGPAAAQSGPAEGIRFAFPLACALGETCWVYQYPDLDPGPGWRDYRGGKRSYDGHKGTDIGIEDSPDLENGIPVLAAAAGTVLRTRDGVADIAVTDETREDVSSIGCGNAIVLDHGVREGGQWTTVYCHLQKDSVLVNPGDRVEEGAAIGLMGLSGLTKFPHLHFQVQKDGQIVDPTPSGLWQEETAEAIQAAYVPTLLHLGFATRAPQLEQIIAGGLEPESLARNKAGDFLFYATILGATEGLELSLSLAGPDGRLRTENTVKIERDQLMSTTWIGLRDITRQAAGTYRGVARLFLAGTQISEKTVSVTLLP